MYSTYLITRTDQGKPDNSHRIKRKIKSQPHQQTRLHILILLITLHFVLAFAHNYAQNGLSD